MRTSILNRKEMFTSTDDFKELVVKQLKQITSMDKTTQRPNTPLFQGREKHVVKFPLSDHHCNNQYQYGHIPYKQHSPYDVYK